jgi:hypothetical protein
MAYGDVWTWTALATEQADPERSMEHPEFYRQLLDLATRIAYARITFDVGAEPCSLAKLGLRPQTIRPGPQ